MFNFCNQNNLTQATVTLHHFWYTWYIIAWMNNYHNWVYKHISNLCKLVLFKIFTTASSLNFIMHLLDCTPISACSPMTLQHYLKTELMEIQRSRASETCIGKLSTPVLIPRAHSALTHIALLAFKMHVYFLPGILSLFSFSLDSEQAGDLIIGPLSQACLMNLNADPTPVFPNPILGDPQSLQVFAPSVGPQGPD